MDFDPAREERNSQPATFKIGGEVFSYRHGLRPETFEEAISEWTSWIDERTQPSGNGEGADAGQEDLSDVLSVVDRTIRNFLAGDEDRQRWDELRKREEDAVTSGDMRAVLEFLIGEQTGRPTQAASNSGEPQNRTGRTSTGRSSSPRVVSAA